MTLLMEHLTEAKAIRRRGAVLQFWRVRHGVKVPALECLAPVERVGDAQWCRWMAWMMRDGDETEETLA